MPLALLFLLAAAAGADPSTAAPAPAARQVSPVTVSPAPAETGKPQVTVVGGDFDFVAGQDVSIWPASALARRSSGKVTLKCRVDVHGLAESCKVASEEPRGLGFGAAALALRPTLKLNPNKGPDGEPIDSDMLVGINFKAPEAENNVEEVLHFGRDLPAQGEMKTTTIGGEKSLNASDLYLYHNPIPMRRLTMMTEPAWSQTPDFDAVAKAYPAQGGGVEGYAVAHCQAERTGVLSRCVTAKEFPTAHGFGKAAVALASQFRVSPQLMAEAPHGAPVEVDVPVRFPPPAQANDHTVRSPLWVEAFDAQTAAQYFPPEAAAKGVRSGEAVVRCRVADDGSLSGCSTEMAKPDGMGFDDAAVKVASTMKMNLWSGEASPVRGGVVHLPIKLQAPDGAN